MRHLIFTIILFLSCTIALPAQKGLEGLWEGTISRGGLQGDNSYKFELLIQVEGNRIKGRSYVHLSEDEVLEMDVHGYLYQDRSMYIQDLEFIPALNSKAAPGFYRKYQMIYNRSIFGSTLEGYWQEIIISPFDRRRDRGKITLKKADGSKA